MRAFPVLLLAMLAACTTPEVNAPSLAPRPAEAIDPRAPVPEPAVPTEPSPGLVQQLDGLVAAAVAGDAAFQPAIDKAERLAEAAGARESESWVVAQQALSIALSARNSVNEAGAEIDSIGAERIQRLGGIAPADMTAIETAAARVREIDEREVAAINRIQARLNR